jgi:hypothetical protein
MRFINILVCILAIATCFAQQGPNSKKDTGGRTDIGGSKPLVKIKIKHADPLMIMMLLSGKRVTKPEYSQAPYSKVGL